MSKSGRSLLVSLAGVCLVFFLTACAASLREAKHFLVQGQEFSRGYSEEEAIASYKASLRSAEKSVRKHPSAQSYVIKGIAELNLELWDEATKSFRAAFSFGFEDGEAWAQWVSLYGLSLSMERLGLEQFAFEVFEHLIAKSRLQPVTVLAAQEYSRIQLKRALEEEGKEKDRLLWELMKKVESLIQKDLSCGYYHYLLSQICGHLAEYRRSFEEAVVARELEVPKREIFRDNDLQIVFCYRKLRQELSPGAWKEFLSLYQGWIERWGWSGPETPDWKE
jgi:hypothetical protein